MFLKIKNNAVKSTGVIMMLTMTGLLGAAYNSLNAKEAETNIKITAGGKIIKATLNNSKTANDFLALLPLELTLTDYAGKEKISNLPKKLSVENAPSGADPDVGGIAYYAPWGNIAIFYKEHGYSDGLIMLGKIHDGLEILKSDKPLKVIIEVDFGGK